jgi:signal transduction histidine kinase
MAGLPAQHELAPLSEVGERQKRFAALIEAERAAILASYAERLEAMFGGVAEPSTRGPAMAEAAEIIADVMVSVRGGAPVEDHYAMFAQAACQDGRDSQGDPADLLIETTAFSDIVVCALAGHVKDDPGLLPSFVIAVRALNESISRRMRRAVRAYTGKLLERVEQARVDERRRIARDLHDKLGEGMSAALRQLELHEIASEHGTLTPRPRVAMAKQAITEGMRRLRVVTSDLRQEPVKSLERALVQYVDSVAADANVRLRVSGDETWVPPTFVEETFFILQEAFRNAIRHGNSQMVLIGVACAPHQLHAWVEDDGCGFVPAQHAEPTGTSTGLASMRERACLLGGRLTIAAAPAQGTHVELVVPLPGCRDE